MKRLRLFLVCFVGVAILLLSLSASIAGTGIYVIKAWKLSLVAGDPSGVTPSGTSTSPSGVSPMIVNNSPSGASNIYIADMKDATFVIQLNGVSAITPTQASLPLGTNAQLSGTTGTVRIRETVLDTDDHWAASGTSDIWIGVAMNSGTSLQAVVFVPKAIGFIRYEWVSGTTPVALAEFTVAAIDRR